MYYGLATFHRKGLRCIEETQPALNTHTLLESEPYSWHIRLPRYMHLPRCVHLQHVRPPPDSPLRALVSGLTFSLLVMSNAQAKDHGVVSAGRSEPSESLGPTSANTLILRTATTEGVGTAPTFREWPWKVQHA